jgi:ATP-dependent Clp protease protease subunit
MTSSMKALRSLFGSLLPERAQVDVDNRMLADRIVIIDSAIDDLVANHVIAKLLYLKNCDGALPIKLYVSTPGGRVTSGLAILDAMDHVGVAIETVAIGRVSALGVHIVAHGLRGKRSAMKSAELSLSPLWCECVRDCAADKEQGVEIQRLQTLLNCGLARDTGRSEQVIGADTGRRRRFSAAESLEYGLIDKVIEQCNRA